MGIFFKILGIVGIVLACAVGLVILVIAALLPAKVKVRIGYIENEFILSFKLLFFRYMVAPEKAKKKKKAKKSESVSGYQIQYSTDKKFKKNVRTKKCGKKKNSLTVSKLKAKKKYYVRMRKFRNVKKDGKKSRIYGSFSKVKKVKVR